MPPSVLGPAYLKDNFGKDKNIQTAFLQAVAHQKKGDLFTVIKKKTSKNDMSGTGELGGWGGFSPPPPSNFSEKIKTY